VQLGPNIAMYDCLKIIKGINKLEC
jgi:hypothetical protein